MARRLGSSGEDGFVGEDAVEGGAADAELSGGAEFVSVVDFEDGLDVMVDDGIEGEAFDFQDGLEAWRGVDAIEDADVGGTDDAVGGLEQCGFKHACEFADVAGPGVLEEAAEGSRSEGDRALLIAVADAFEEELSEGGDIFAALAKGRNGEADGGKAEGEVGEEQALAGHLAQGCLGGCQDYGASGGTVLESLEEAEEQALSGRGEEVDAIKVGEAGKSGRIGIGYQPLAGIAALKDGCVGGVAEWGTAVEIAGQGLLADSGLAFNGGDLQVGRGDLGLHDQFAPGRAHAHHLHCRVGFKINKPQAGVGELKWSRALHGNQDASPHSLAPSGCSRPTNVISAGQEET